MMIVLPKGRCENLVIAPRWPDKNVVVDKAALEALQNVQNRLAADMQIILTRAYQKETAVLKWLRKIGASLFSVIYKKRRGEIGDIFHHNGHAMDGTHVDIGIALKGRKINFLPFSVFTSEAKLNRKRAHYKLTLEQVGQALGAERFFIHPNQTEALQIHCDWISSI